MNNKVLYRKLEDDEYYEDDCYREIEILNAPVPKGISFYINIGKNSHCSFFICPSTCLFVNCTISLGIFLNKNDLNLQVLMHEIGHYLDSKVRNFGNGFGWDREEDEMQADMLGARYYRHVTGNNFKLDIFKTKCSGIPNSREVK